jgi:hypothetical protein
MSATGVRDTHPDVDGAIRLLHRRRGCAWTGAASLLALVVFTFFGSGAGSGTVSDLVSAVLLAIAVAGFATVITDTIRLHRRFHLVRHQARRQGRPGADHHPGAARVYRYPPRHPVSDCFAMLLGLLFLGLAVGYLPYQVNAVAYLAGAGQQATFRPVSHERVCDRASCATETVGVMVAGTRTMGTTWPDDVPLGVPVKVRAPVWDGWTGSLRLMDSDSSAVGWLLFGLFFDLAGYGAGFLVYLMTKLWLRRRRQTAAPA